MSEEASRALSFCSLLASRLLSSQGQVPTSPSLEIYSLPTIHRRLLPPAGLELLVSQAPPPVHPPILVEPVGNRQVL